MHHLSFCNCILDRCRDHYSRVAFFSEYRTLGAERATLAAIKNWDGTKKRRIPTNVIRIQNYGLYHATYDTSLLTTTTPPQSLRLRTKAFRPETDTPYVCELTGVTNSTRRTRYTCTEWGSTVIYKVKIFTRHHRQFYTRFLSVRDTPVRSRHLLLVNNYLSIHADSCLC